MPVIISYATPAEGLGIIDLLESVNLVSDEDTATESLKRKMFADPESILTAMVNEELVGCVFTSQDEWTATVYNLAVAKDQRRLGIGSALLRTAVGIASLRGSISTTALIDMDNHESANFFNHHGYSLMGGTYLMVAKTT